MRFEPKLPKTDETSGHLEEAGLEVLEYDRQFGYHKIRLSAEAIEKDQQRLVSPMKEAFDARL